MTVTTRRQASAYRACMQRKGAEGGGRAHGHRCPNEVASQRAFVGTAPCAILMMLVMVICGCRRERDPSQSISDKTPTAMPDGSNAPSSSSAQPTAPPADIDGTAIDDARPAPVGADMPTPTTAASSADATSAAPDVPVLRAVRLGQHAAHDRIVFEFDGEGMPAWRVEYVAAPVTDCGAGNVVPLAGDARLQIRFSGANAHTPAGQPTGGPARRRVNQPALLELVRTCDFEAEVTWVAGVAKKTPYKPRVLANPSRLVIDVAY